MKNFLISLVKKKFFKDNILTFLADTYLFFNILKSDKERSLFIAESVIKTHLFSVVESVSIDVKNNFDIVLKQNLAKNIDFPPFVIEGVVFNYVKLKPLSTFDLNYIIPELGIDYKCQTRCSMLHVGLGMAYALMAIQKYLAMKKNDEAMRCVIKNFIDECRKNSQRGYVGCAIEALGLIIGIYGKGYPTLIYFCKLIVSIYEPEDAENYLAWCFFGFGRSCYFLPSNFFPSKNTHFKYKSVLSIESIIVENELYFKDRILDIVNKNLIHGFFWAVCATSLTCPEILLDYLIFSAANMNFFVQYKNAVKSGIGANIKMLQLTKLYKINNKIPTVEKFFLNYRPNTKNANDIWEDFVLKPVSYYQKNEKLSIEDIFRYQSQDEY